MRKIHILNCEFGNIKSLKNSLDYLEIDNEVIDNINNTKNISHLVLPGVGNFKQCASILKKKNFYEIINNYIEQKKNLLGICIGMQLMFESGDEGGGSNGLRIFKGNCKKLNTDENFPLPHIGFNLVNKPESLLWQEINDNSNFYFIHEYGIPIDVMFDNPGCKFGTTKYKSDFISYIENKNGNICGAQFHPEKSQLTGLKFLKNFSKI